MGVGHSLEHIEEQMDAGLFIVALLVAVAIDLIALDVFENKIRLPRRQHARIYQFGNVRMNQKSQNPALAAEAFLPVPPHEGEGEKLFCFLAFKSSIVSFRQPYTAHPALANLRHQGVHTQSL